MRTVGKRGANTERGVVRIRRERKRGANTERWEEWCEYGERGDEKRGEGRGMRRDWEWE